MRTSLVPSRHALRLLVAGPLALLMVMVLAATAWAQTGQQRLDGKIRSADQITIGADEVVDHDLYVSGGRIDVDGTIDGDLIAAGGQVAVRGTVTGDVMMAGGSLRISGNVDGTVRAAGGEVVVAGDVGQDLFSAGGRIRIADTGTVGGDWVFGGGEVINSGEVGGSALGRAGQYTDNGTVAGTQDVMVGEGSDEDPGLAEQVGDVLARYLSLLIVAALVLAVARRPLRAGADRVARQPLGSLAAGLLAIVGAVLAVVVAVILLAVLALLLAWVGMEGLVGLAVIVAVLAVVAVVLALFVALAFLAQIVVGLWLGGLALGDVDSWPRAFGAAALGLAVIVLLVQVPLLGPVLSALVAVLGTGGLVLAAWQTRQSRTARATPERQPAR